MGHSILILNLTIPNCDGGSNSSILNQPTNELSMKLYYDRNDLPDSQRLKDQRIEWLQELGATELGKADPDAVGFLFGYEEGESHLLNQLVNYPGIHDRPDERQELVCLDDVLKKLKDHSIEVPTPKTWVLEIDDEVPSDLEFPLFVRTRKSSWKRGGEQARVRNLCELNDEAELLRRAFGWDAPIIVRKWLDIAVAGKWIFGDAPQEIRTWIIDGEPVAWSFHYLHAIENPDGFPPSVDDLRQLQSLAATIAQPFKSRLIAADFVRDKTGKWNFMEAGPGAACGTAHEQVFKYVASRLIGKDFELKGDAVGGYL